MVVRFIGVKYMPRFLNVPEGRTCRYDSQITSAEIEGLYTDNFSVCNIVVFYKHEGAHIRVSMTHADRFITFEQIERERNWIGDNAIAFVVAKNIEGSSGIRQQALGDLLTLFDIKQCDLTNFALSFGKQGLSYYTRDTVPALATHPLEWKLHSTYMLNIMFDHTVSELKNTTLLYDVDRWCPLLKHDTELSRAAKAFYNQFSSAMPHFEFCSKITADSITSGILAANHIEANRDNKVEMAWRSLLLFTENNYQFIYNAQLQHVLSLKEQMTVAQLKFIEKLLRHTQANFEQFPLFDAELAQLPALTICTLRGIYKICRRAKQHDTPFSATPPLALLNDSNRERQESLFTPGLFGRNSVPWCAPPPGSVIDGHGCTVVPV